MLQCRWKLSTPMAVLCMQDLEVQCTWPSGSWDWEVAGSVESWVNEIMGPVPALRSSRTSCELHQVGTGFFFSPLIFANQSSPRLPNPKGRPGMSDVPSCLESQGCYIWFPFPNSLVFFCLVLLFFLSCHFSANGPFFWLFSRKFSNIFR